jgi:membrane protease YdiL (CAAX protease family)
VKSHVRQFFFYQLGLLAIAAGSVAAVGKYGLGDVYGYLKFGDLNRTLGAIPWLGIKEHETWNSMGLSFALSVSTVTFLFMWREARRLEVYYVHAFRRYWPWVLVFSLSNALGEELIFRVALVGIALTHVSPPEAIVASGAIFGLAHWRGQPGGVFGVLMAGALGAILAKSMIETGGLAVAFGLHFLQDVLIIPVLLAFKQRELDEA